MGKPSTLAIVPRRITVTSAVLLFPEPRFAWAVPTEAPFTVAKEPQWQIIGLSHARSVIEYAAESAAGRTVGELLYAAAEDEMTREADWPVVRFLPLDELEDGALEPKHVAFSFESAEVRAAANAERANAERPKKTRTRITSLGRGLRDLTAPAEAKA